MGFAVVADEVQQLAVKSSQAAKEVEAIVKAIRADTSRASESMEKAITEVSTGSKLAGCRVCAQQDRDCFKEFGGLDTRNFHCC